MNLFLVHLLKVYHYISKSKGYDSDEAIYESSY